MDFITSLFSFIPLLMIILFIVRFVAGVGKRKKPRPLNTIPPDPVSEPTPVPRPKKTDGVQPSEAEHNPVQTAESVPESVRTPEPKQPRESGANPKQKPPPPPPEPAVEPFKQIDRPPLSATTYTESTPTVSRLNRLSKLKKAVVWAEILGKPRGLE